MKHLDLWDKYKELDNLEIEQLKAAVLAHGGEYVFLDVEKDYEEAGEEEPSMPCIMAGKKYSDYYEDYYITKVKVEDGKYLTLYGYPKDGYRSDEYVIDDVAHGGYGWITDMVPETEDVTDVSEVGVNQEFVWTKDAIINLQYITAYGEKWGVEHQEMMNDWPERFEMYQRMAIEFSKDEPDWDKSDIDYETAIEAFCKTKLGY